MKAVVDLEKIEKIEKDIIKAIDKKDVMVKTDRFKNAFKKIVTSNTYDTEEDLSEAILGYFDFVEGETYEVDTKRGIQLHVKTPTDKGLKLHLGVNNKEWEKLNRVFPDIMCWAKDNIEDMILSRATSGITNNVMSMFNLKNKHGYKDTNEEQTQKGINIVIGGGIEKKIKEAEKFDEEYHVNNIRNSLGKAGLNIEKGGVSLGSKES